MQVIMDVGRVAVNNAWQDEQHPLEISAGLILMRKREPTIMEALVISRTGDLEIPKGHVEGDETLLEAAQRELIEETGIMNPVVIGPKVGVTRYMVKSTREPHRGQIVPKEVHYFAAFLRNDDDHLNIGVREKQTKKLHWLSVSEWEMAKFRTTDQKTLVGNALKLAMKSIATKHC
eukprot:Blabericola_migrator_1__4126@NODE_225_length_11139_cov_51_682262_g191_i0_p8_GENE_NODE_225_length_11139_cov_51_682262_g191_i0NODE_225_length_11139_cov_51_682262_g191_i0_p8_ORF_typecomplete_len176_score28_78NUDIX/PF00293_28/2_6e15_NODE_225_length_11139_cov_51_682262_g191_i01057111098